MSLSIKLLNRNHSLLSHFPLWSVLSISTYWYSQCHHDGCGECKCLAALACRFDNNNTIDRRTGEMLRQLATSLGRRAILLPRHRACYTTILLCWDTIMQECRHSEQFHRLTASASPGTLPFWARHSQQVVYSVRRMYSAQ